MKKLILQVWEDSESNDVVRQGECSIHLTEKDRLDYIESIYKKRDPELVPDTYSRLSGDFIEVYASDVIYNFTKKEKNVVLMPYEINNLLNMEEVIMASKH